MRTNTLRSLIPPSLAVTLAAACGACKGHSSVPLDNSTATGFSETVNSSTVNSKLYSAPDDSFTVNIPAGWQVERSEHDGAYMTVIRSGQQRAENVSIMTFEVPPAATDPAELKSFELIEISKPFFKNWLEGLSEQARVEGTGEIEPTRFDSLSALRMNVTYYRGDANDPRRGRCIFLLGSKTAFFICLTASSSRFGALEDVTSTLRVEP
jgi:hypothetical protein